MKRLLAYWRFARTVGPWTLVRYERARRSGKQINYRAIFTTAELARLEAAGFAPWREAAPAGEEGRSYGV